MRTKIIVPISTKNSTEKKSNWFSKTFRYHKLYEHVYLVCYWSLQHFWTKSWCFPQVRQQQRHFVLRARPKYRSKSYLHTQIINSLWAVRIPKSALIKNEKCFDNFYKSWWLQFIVLLLSFYKEGRWYFLFTQCAHHKVDDHYLPSLPHARPLIDSIM